MYTSYIGRRLLALYRMRTGENLSARQFFEQRLYPLFFAPAKYLQWVPNSPFAQAVAARDLVPGGPTAAEIRLAKLHLNVETVAPDASFVIGFPAAGVEGTTSGQVSGVGPRVEADDIYCSWIGGALGVGVSGGLSLLLEADEVLWALYQGWPHYRAYLDQRPTLKGNQIDTWNGHWLTHAFNRYFNSDDPLAGLKIDLTDTAGTLSIPTKEWVQVLFALTGHYPGRDLMAYVYSLAQTNRTLGFVPLRLRQLRKVYELQDHLFLFPEALRSEGRDQLLRLYETHFGSARACQQGAIGLAAIEPAKLRDFYTQPGDKPKTLAIKDDRTAAQFAFYQIWILAMLNNQALYDAADQLASALHHYAGTATGGKMNLERQVEKVFVKHRPAFIERLTEILEEAKSGAATYVPLFDEAVRQVVLMPVDNFPLFIILVRFRYIARQRGDAATPTQPVQQTLFNA